MTRTSNKEQTPTESSRLVRGAGSTFYEYISKLRTEMEVILYNRVGCDGSHPLLWTDVDGHLMEADHVSDQ